MTENVTTVLQREAQAILNIPVTEDFERATGLIHRQVHEQG